MLKLFIVSFLFSVLSFAQLGINSEVYEVCEINYNDYTLENCEVYNEFNSIVFNFDEEAVYISGEDFLEFTIVSGYQDEYGEIYTYDCVNSSGAQFTVILNMDESYVLVIPIEYSGFSAIKFYIESYME